MIPATATQIPVKREATTNKNANGDRSIDAQVRGLGLPEPEGIQGSGKHHGHKQSGNGGNQHDANQDRVGFIQ